MFRTPYDEMPMTGIPRAMPVLRKCVSCDACSRVRSGLVCDGGRRSERMVCHPGGGGGGGVMVAVVMTKGGKATGKVDI